MDQIDRIEQAYNISVNPGDGWSRDPLEMDGTNLQRCSNY